MATAKKGCEAAEMIREREGDRERQTGDRKKRAKPYERGREVPQSLHFYDPKDQKLVLSFSSQRPEGCSTETSLQLTSNEGYTDLT